MSVLRVIEQLILEPLVLVLETVYGASLNWTGSYGAAIIPLSLAVNFMLLPFYKRADEIQAEERAAQERMKVGLSHIRASFSGDERYMMQQVYYRQNNYKPIYSLRSILPLVLEIPFFIAAYRFLSGIQAFNGQSFGSFLRNLGEPDQMLSIGSIKINVLPIVMTVINIISSEIYTRKTPLKEKLTLHGMALVFLILLYNSPSALVFYWTLNNLFSLVKNIINAVSRPRLFRCIAYSALGVISIVYSILGIPSFTTGQMVFSIIGIMLQIPTVIYIFECKNGVRKPSATEVRGDTSAFRTGCVFLALFTGLLIPSAVIASSPAEFMLASNPRTPFFHVLPSLLIAVGLFVLWFGLFYYLSTPHVRGIFTVAVIAMSGIGVVSYLFFGTSMGTLLPLLQYEKTPHFTSVELTLNVEVLLVVVTLLLVLWLKKCDWLNHILIAACVAIIGLSFYNGVRIQRTVPLALKTLNQEDGNDNHFSFSTNGKNVVVVMIDRAVGAFLPYLFNERPELEKQFDGFTWYPNTLSYSNSTNTGSPPIYGGYDYRPEQMNERDDMLLVDKHNGVLKTMPVIFSEVWYDVTVCDPPYANYNWIPDLSIFDDYPEITTFLTESGQFREKGTDDERQRIWDRNFFCFSIMKSSPLILQPFLYQGGTYFDGKLIGKESDYIQKREGISRARGYRDNFLNAYAAICAYPSLTQVTDMDKNTFTMLYNSTAHNAALLKEPEYEPVLEIDNTEYDKVHKSRFTLHGMKMNVEKEDVMMSYHCNMAAIIKLGEWFDDLRAKGVYNNTRIIIVSDHGAMIDCFDDMKFGERVYENVICYNPILMVKDFNDAGFSKDDSFMTNADTPTLAMERLIDDPVSPFTGKEINSKAKKENIHHVFYTVEWQTTFNNGTTFLPGVWTVLSSDDIFDMSSWKTIGKLEK